MRVKCSAGGFWLIDRYGRSVRHPWHTLLVFVGTPVLFLFCMALALNRSTHFLALLRDSPRQGIALFAAFLRTCPENVLGLDQPPVESELPTLRLQVPRNAMQEMHRAHLTGDRRLGNEPGGDRPYFAATYEDESGRVQKAKIAYRGTFDYHHWPEKPSLRVKIRISDVALGRRYVELSRPKDALGIRNQLPEMLARQIGLISTINERVRLFINNKYFGVYLRTYRPSEELALANDHMPGSFFKGDAIGEFDDLDLWGSIDAWKVFGAAATAGPPKPGKVVKDSKGEGAEEDRALFERFLAVVREPASAESNLRLQRLLDPERFAQWAAVMILSGCAHTDAKHNQTYFLCSNQGKLEAMPWDPTCYEKAGRDFTPVELVNHPVMDHMIRNPHWVHRRNQILHELVCGIGSASQIHRSIDEQIGRMLPDLKADSELSEKTIHADRTPRSVWDIDDEISEFKHWAVAKEQFLRQWLDQARVYVEPDPAHPGQSRVHVFGTVAVRAERRDGQPLELRDGAGGPVRLLFPGLSEEICFTTFQPDDVAVQLPCVAAAPLVYRADASPEQLTFYNAVTGARVTTEAQPPVWHGAVRTLPPSQFPDEPTGAVVLGPGVQVIEQDLHVGPAQTLVIRPNTTLRLAPGVGIYSCGKVLAQSTAEAPIVLEPAGDGPWAAFGVSGPATTGSRFEHLTASGGSVGTNGWVRFKGMFSVYDCPDVELRRCQFGRNFVGDDTVNLAQSHVVVEECTWDDARSDALDMDMCRGRVVGCQMRNSGNDGLDLMTCRLWVSDCLFENSDDKGISAGEGTRIVVRRCRMLGCSKGIEAKDSARVAVFDTLFDRNKIGYHSYQKKWLYPRGGSGLLVDCTFRNDTEATLGLERRCDLALLRTQIGLIQQGQERVRRVDAVDEGWQRFIESIEGLEAQPHVAQLVAGGPRGQETP